jgi:hypothetical protein
MKSRRAFAFQCLATWTCALCVTHAARAQVTRAEALRIAESYASHQWTATKRNVLHGADADGVRVDTPDVKYHPRGATPGWWTPGRANEGVPYMWGGFCTPGEFDAGIQAGKAAGDVCTPEKRRRLDDAVSSRAVGIDCSGFISRCWKLDRSFSTRELPALCIALRDARELKPGDIMNLENVHALLFKAWADDARTRVIAYETGSPLGWKVIRDDMPLSALIEAGYKPFRYRKISD